MAKNGYILDDRSQYYDYGSDCESCVHFDSVKYTCNAFPDGIPISILKGARKHREPWKSQKGKYTFKSK